MSPSPELLAFAPMLVAAVAVAYLVWRYKRDSPGIRRPAPETVYADGPMIHDGSGAAHSPDTGCAADGGGSCGCDGGAGCD